MLVDAVFQQIVETDRRGLPSYGASTLLVWTRRAGNEITVEAADAHHSPLVIVTVTWADAKYQESAPENVAASWETILHNALVDALRKREPTVERANLAQVLRVAAGLVVSTVLLLLVLRSLQRRMNGLADVTGLVEQVSLRMVMIRDLAASVVTISHSAVTAVSNYSRVWSRIDYKVSIAAEADPTRRSTRSEPAWKN